MKTPTILLLLITFATATAAQTPVFPEVSNKVKHTLGFPGVCKVPNPSSPVPIPYPNVVDKSRSDFAKGTKRLVGGGEVRFKEETVPGTSKRLLPAYRVTVSDRSGKDVKLTDSMLMELEDGSYCAVCVENDRVTAVLRLTAH